MDDNLNYETYIYISSSKLFISIYTNLNKKVYEEEIRIEQISTQLIFQELNDFLSKNILKIEKKLNNFIKNTSVILDLDEIFSFEISVKKNNFDNIISTKILNHLLYDLKDYCKKTIDEKKIIHMMINNYQVDNKDYHFLPKEINCNKFSLDVKFLCLSVALIKDLENIFKKYQISLDCIVSAKYIKEFLTNKDEDISLIAKKMINGHNSNEVKLVDKTIKNKGFFEKFFNFFN